MENQLLFQNDKIIISTKNNISLYLMLTVIKIWDLNIKSNISPIISGNTIFTVNNDNYFIFIDKNNGQILFSKNINSLITKRF